MSITRINPEYQPKGNYAAASHGNHVPATQAASDKVFLRNDNTWQTVTPANIGAAASGHTHGTLLYNGNLTLSAGQEISLNGSLTGYAYYDVFAYGVIKNSSGSVTGSRKISTRVWQWDVGVAHSAISYVVLSMFYNTSWFAYVGFSASSATKIKVAELNKAGFDHLCLARITGYSY